MKTDFWYKQHSVLNQLRAERDIVEKGNKKAEGKPVMSIHDIRIEELEKFLGIRK